MNVLLTGGAGYVGSVVSDGLLGAGYEVTIVDNLQQGHREAVPSGADFILADISDPGAMAGVFKKRRYEVLMHMAAETVVEFSTTDPKRYFETNVSAGINLLNIMLKQDVHKIIFSSTAAVYGEPQTTPIDELHPKNPMNAYGASKLMFEDILEWYGHAYGLKHISLRYFNAAGATHKLGECHNPETHLIPNVLRAALTGKDVPIFGMDYPTRDGSCIRDYVHVLDIASAHILAMKKLDSLNAGVYNLGSQNGYSVMDVVQVARKVTRTDISTKVYPRRAGDPAVLVASAARAKAELNWRPEHAELEKIIESAWEWTCNHVNGYTQ